MLPRNPEKLFIEPGAFLRGSRVRVALLAENAVGILALIYLAVQLVRWGFNGFAL